MVDYIFNARFIQGMNQNLNKSIIFEKITSSSPFRLPADVDSDWLTTNTVGLKLETPLHTWVLLVKTCQESIHRQLPIHARTGLLSYLSSPATPYLGRFCIGPRYVVWKGTKIKRAGGHGAWVLVFPKF